MGGAEVPGERDRRGGLLTDLYELNMAAVYLRRGMRAAATFSLFVRQLPPDRGFLVAAGLADCLKFLEHFGFSPDDLDWLEANLGLDPVTLDAFAELGFTRGPVGGGRFPRVGWYWRGSRCWRSPPPSPRPSWSRRPC
jgi:nicotinic acid phosphoribosyltransferase